MHEDGSVHAFKATLPRRVVAQQHQDTSSSSSSALYGTRKNTLTWIVAGYMTGWTLATAPLPSFAASDTVYQHQQLGTMVYKICFSFRGPSIMTSTTTHCMNFESW